MIKITSADQVSIKDNLLIINSGFSSNNLIPLCTITFVSEVMIHQLPESPYFHLRINTEDIQTLTYTTDTEKTRLRELIYEVHNKIHKGLAEYHTASFKLTKPKKIDL